MASDADWVEDVRRWYLAGRRDSLVTPPPARNREDASGDGVAVGYEAAHPAPQAQNWPDAPTAAAGTPASAR